MQITFHHKAIGNLSLKTVPVIFPSRLITVCFLLARHGIAVEKPSRDVMVAFSEGKSDC